MRIVILIVLAIFGLAAVACTSQAPSPADTQTASPPTPDVPATVEAGVIATREAETAIDATVEAKVAAALTAPTPTTAPMPTATPKATNTPYPTAAPQPTPTTALTMAEYAPDDHGNDFEGATRIAIGEAVTFELENNDDIDVLVFRARPGTEFLLTLDWEYYEFRENYRESPLLAVYSANGQEQTRLMGYDLYETGGPSIDLVWRAVTGGDYYIVIGDGNTEGAFALAVTEGEATEPEATPAPTERPAETEPKATPAPTAPTAPTAERPTLVEEDDHGNDFEGATRIAIGEAVTFELENKDDIDVLVFRARAGTEFLLTLDWEYYEFRENYRESPLLAVYSANGQEQTRLMGYDLFETGGPSIGLVWRAVTGGDYYIVIGDGNTEGASALTLTEGEATEPEATPAPPASSFVSVSAGWLHTCGVKRDGSVACWGSNEDLDGNVVGQATPPAGKFASVSAGVLYTCGVRSDGSVACWGYNDYGQSTPPVGSFVSVSAGAAHTCGVRSDGSVACWGYNEDGQATPPAGSFVSVSAGWLHTCGVKRDGSVACWGSNEDLDGNVVGQATPPAGKFASVSAGVLYTCGVRSDGSVACWGYNDYGQSTPPVGSFVSVSAGAAHTCGVRSDGSVACWGWDEFGQATPPAGSFVSVSAGADIHTCGVRSNGSVACWGDNEFGQATPPE